MHINPQAICVGGFIQRCRQQEKGASRPAASPTVLSSMSHVFVAVYSTLMAKVAVCPIAMPLCLTSNFLYIHPITSHHITSHAHVHTAGDMVGSRLSLHRLRRLGAPPSRRCCCCCGPAA